MPRITPKGPSQIAQSAKKAITDSAKQVGTKIGDAKNSFVGKALRAAKGPMAERSWNAKVSNEKERKEFKSIQKRQVQFEKMTPYQRQAQAQAHAAKKKG